MESNRSEAMVIAAEILIANVMGTLNGLSYSAKQVNLATSALFALDWAPSLVSSIGSDRLTRLCTRLKISKLAKSDYVLLIKLVNLPTTDPSAMFPFSMESWRALIIRFGLEDLASFPEWLTTLYELQNCLIDTPEQLAVLSFEAARSLADRATSQLPIMRLWQSACVASGSLQRGASTGELSTNANLIASSIRATHIENTGYARKHKRARNRLDVPENFDELGPAKKALALARGSNDISSINSFLSSGVPVNILRQAEYSLGSIASGVQCWIAYCNLIGHPFFPPTTQRVCSWSTLFKAGGTFGLYVAHLSKACMILGIPTDWYDSSVSAVSRGLRKAQDLSGKFDNYMLRPDLQAFIAHESLSSDFGLLGYLSFLFLLRVQSEGLPLRRVSINDNLLDRSRGSFPALIGLCDINGENRLVMKLA